MITCDTPECSNTPGYERAPMWCSKCQDRAMDAWLAENPMCEDVGCSAPAEGSSPALFCVDGHRLYYALKTDGDGTMYYTPPNYGL